MSFLTKNRLKKGYMEMKNFIFLVPVKSVLGSSILYYSPDIRQNSDGCISDFWISGQSFIKENCHNSRTTDDIDMKLRPVTKRYKRNKTTLKKIYDDVMAENCDVIVIFTIYG